jgi:hypothetical protein
MTRICLLAALFGLALAAETSPNPLADLEARADEVVRVNLTAPVLRALSQATPEDAEEARFLKALAGVSGIRVVVYEFAGREMPDSDDVNAVRAAMIPADWPRFLTSRSKDPDELVHGYAGPGGLALIVAEAGEITAVHIDGMISGSALPVLSHRFGLPALGAADTGPTDKGIPAAAESAPVRTVHAEALSFGRLVHDLEAESGVQHMHVPLMGAAMKVASPIAYVASGGRAKAINVAIFEGAPPSFTDDVDKVLPEGWSRLVEVREPDESTNIYVGEVGRWMPMLIATRDSDDGVLVTVKASLKDLFKSPLDWTHHNDE